MSRNIDHRRWSRKMSSIGEIKKTTFNPNFKSKKLCSSESESRQEILHMMCQFSSCMFPWTYEMKATPESKRCPLRLIQIQHGIQNTEHHFKFDAVCQAHKLFAEN